MPFDGREPKLGDLAQLLRQPERWPRDFRWNYRCRETCAVGLCERIYGKNSLHRMAPGYLNNGGNNVTNTIFCGMCGKTTSIDVADAIDAYLKTKRVQRRREAIGAFAAVLIAVALIFIPG
jgi:hypothetical protein